MDLKALNYFLIKFKLKRLTRVIKFDAPLDFSCTKNA